MDECVAKAKQQKHSPDAIKRICETIAKDSKSAEGESPSGVEPTFSPTTTQSKDPAGTGVPDKQYDVSKYSDADQSAIGLVSELNVDEDIARSYCENAFLPTSKAGKGAMSQQIISEFLITGTFKEVKKVKNASGSKPSYLGIERWKETGEIANNTNTKNASVEDKLENVFLGQRNPNVKILNEIAEDNAIPTQTRTDD
jgi:hypothetical protein